MTRDDYQAIANAISAASRPDGTLAWVDLVNALSAYFRAHDPRFDPVRFVEACERHD